MYHQIRLPRRRMKGWMDRLVDEDNFNERKESELILKDWAGLTLSEGTREIYSISLKLCDLNFRGWNIHCKK